MTLFINYLYKNIGLNLNKYSKYISVKLNSKVINDCIKNKNTFKSEYKSSTYIDR